MNTTYQASLQPITLPNGVELKSQTTMAPMVVKGANDNGTISELDVVYFDKRSDVVGRAALQEPKFTKKSSKPAQMRFILQ